MEYIVQDKLGIHARPAGLIVKESSRFNSDIEIEKDGSRVNAKKLFALIGLNIRYGDTITVYISGEDEKEAYADIKKLFDSLIN